MGGFQTENPGFMELDNPNSSLNTAGLIVRFIVPAIAVKISGSARQRDITFSCWARAIPKCACVDSNFFKAGFGSKL